MMLKTIIIRRIANTITAIQPNHTVRLVPSIFDISLQDDFTAKQEQ